MALSEKKKDKTQTNFLHHEFDFFRVQHKFTFRIRPLEIDDKVAQQIFVQFD